MLNSTHKIYLHYNSEAKMHTREISGRTIEQIHRDYLETIFTAALRRRFDIWDFVQKFMESDFSLSLDRAETMLSLKQDEVFRDFTIFCIHNNIELKLIEGDKAGMAAFRDITPEAKWLAQLYSIWHAQTGEAGCEIAERAPTSLLRKICRKAMEHEVREIIALLIERTKDEARITNKDYDILEEEERNASTNVRTS